jgi:hypothetical protein
MKKIVSDAKSKTSDQKRTAENDAAGFDASDDWAGIFTIKLHLPDC